MKTHPIKPLALLACLFLPPVAFAQTALITTQPESRSAHPGSMVIFGVRAIAGQYAYQWQLDGEAISDANGETLTIEANPESAGAYTVVVSDGQNSEVSAPATLTLLESVGVALDQELESWRMSFDVMGDGIDEVISQENYWISQSEDTFDGVDALVIKSRPNELNAFILQGNFSGAFTMKFKWKSDRPDISFLQFRVNDIASGEIVEAAEKPASGLDWEEVSATVLNPGDYRMSWIHHTVYAPEAVTVWLDQLEARALDAYEVWTYLNFSDEVRAALGAALASTDSDGDGIPNQLEWALLSDPNKPNAPLEFQIIEKEGQRHAAFRFSKNSTLDGYQIVMESSANLKDWIQVSPIELPPESIEEGAEKTIWQDPSSLNATSSRFLRLKVRLAAG